MTARRQENKGHRPRIAVLVTAILGIAMSVVAMSAFSGGAGAATNERVVVDRYTGLAISGYDPVAYFTDGKPVLGQPGVEVSREGVVWRFCNDNNRTFFLAHPEVYAPQFGGYDPVDAARGVIIAGRFNVWLISGSRLYLFSREENRDAFAGDPSRFAAEAAANWPHLKATLSDY
jgi:YHS domain-containing protein